MSTLIKKGEKSIQITSLKNHLTNSIFSSLENLIRKYPRIIKKLDGFKLFIIMDVDDCSVEQRNNFKNRKMFRDHWAYEYIVPIHNTMDLEQVLTDCGIKYDKKAKK